jgi:hypothetical protein
MLGVYASSRVHDIWLEMNPNDGQIRAQSKHPLLRFAVISEEISQDSSVPLSNRGKIQAIAWEILARRMVIRNPMLDGEWSVTMNGRLLYILVHAPSD